jgi:riboflavin kinase/FMN adenylyltransferase
MVNIGVRPTIGADLTQTIETNLIGFSGDLYGKNMDILLDKYMRPEVKVEGLNALKELIDSDKKQISSYYVENFPQILF